jgi:hypothetical protein
MPRACGPVVTIEFRLHQALLSGEQDGKVVLTSKRISRVDKGARLISNRGLNPAGVVTALAPPSLLGVRPLNARFLE